jgi:hypothetical protein
MATTTLRPVTELACERDIEESSFAASPSVYLHGDARFRTWQTKAGATFVEVLDGRHNVLLTLKLATDALTFELVRSIVEARSDVTVGA